MKTQNIISATWTKAVKGCGMSFIAERPTIIWGGTIGF
jgi:hypothetical protein